MNNVASDDTISTALQFYRDKINTIIKTNDASIKRNAVRRTIAAKFTIVECRLCVLVPAFMESVFFERYPFFEYVQAR